jgi:hypothetical protein
MFQPRVEGEHAASVHDVFMGTSTSVSLVTNEDSEYDDDVYDNVARAGDEEDEWQDPDELWLELEVGENKDNGGVFCMSAFTRGEDTEVEDEFVYYLDVSPNREEEPEIRGEGGWWTPDPYWLQPEEEVFFFNTILSEEQEEGKGDQTPTSSL